MQHGSTCGGSSGGKAKKGFLSVQVGLEDDDEQNSQQNHYYDTKDQLQKFVIPIWYLYHPIFMELLDRAREVYGYHIDGPLRLPVSVDDFIHLRWMIEKENRPSDGSRRDVHHHHFYQAPSFRSC